MGCVEVAAQEAVPESVLEPRVAAAEGAVAVFVAGTAVKMAAGKAVLQALVQLAVAAAPAVETQAKVAAMAMVPMGVAEKMEG